MHPQIRVPEPGQCPLCGMDLKRADGTTATRKTPVAKKEPKYACSMFCVPPMPRARQMPHLWNGDGGSGRRSEDAAAHTLTLSETARKLAAVQTVPLERKAVSAEIRMVGKIDYDETRLGYITAWVPGRLDRLYVDYTGVYPSKRATTWSTCTARNWLPAQTELLEALRSEPNPPRTASLPYSTRRAGAWLRRYSRQVPPVGMTDKQIAEIEERGTPSDYMTIYAPHGRHRHSQERPRRNVCTNRDAHLHDRRSRTSLGQAGCLRVRLGVASLRSAGASSRPRPIRERRSPERSLYRSRARCQDPDGQGARQRGECRRTAQTRDVRAGGGSLGRSRPAGAWWMPELAGKWMCPMHPEIVKDNPGDCDSMRHAARSDRVSWLRLRRERRDRSTAGHPRIRSTDHRQAGVVYVELPRRTGNVSRSRNPLGPKVGNQYIVLDGLAEGEIALWSAATSRSTAPCRSWPSPA